MNLEKWKTCRGGVYDGNAVCYYGDNSPFYCLIFRSVSMFGCPHSLHAIRDNLEASLCHGSWKLEDLLFSIYPSSPWYLLAVPLPPRCITDPFRQSWCHHPTPSILPFLFTQTHLRSCMSPHTICIEISHCHSPPQNHPRLLFF